MVRLQAGERNLCLYESVQLGSGAHQAYSIGSSGEGKATGALSLSLTLLSAEVKIESCYTSTTPYVFMPWTGIPLSLPLQLVIKTWRA
jgi:hypothetical protein